MEFLPFDAPVLLFIAPSGTGKSTIVRRLVKDGLVELTPTWTDRPARDGEEELEHVIVTSDELDRKAAEGYFAHEPIYLFNLPYRYASPKIPVPKVNAPATPPRDSRVIKTGLIVLGSLIGIMVLLNILGLQTTTYEAASQFDSLAGWISWAFALGAGMWLSNIISRPSQVKPRSAGMRSFLAIFGFVLGFIPGIILAIIITYPLSTHACELSGSKYC
jgi:hypothetical protein